MTDIEELEETDIKFFRDLIRELDDKMLNKYELNLIEREEIKRKLIQIKEFRFRFEDTDRAKYGYFKCHYHRLNSIFCKLIKNEKESVQEQTIYRNFVFYENLLNNEYDEKEEKSIATNNNSIESTLLNDDLNRILKLINSTEFENEYKTYLNSSPRSMDEYTSFLSYNISINIIINENFADLVIDEKSIQENKEPLEYLRGYTYETYRNKRKTFMELILSYDDNKFQRVFFERELTPHEIDSNFRKYSLYFHPDKNRSLPNQDLCEKIFKRLSETKTKLQQMSFNNMIQYEDYFQEAQQLFKFGLDYLNASKREYSKLIILMKENILSIDEAALKSLSKQYFKKAYENFKSSCIIADLGSQYTKMLDCRLNMSASLFMGDLILEAQLVAAAAVKLTENILFKRHFEEDKKSKASKMLDLVKQKKRDEIVKFFLGLENSIIEPTQTNSTVYIKLNAGIVELEEDQFKREQNSKIYSNNFKKIANITALVPSTAVAVATGSSFVIDVYGAIAGIQSFAGLRISSISFSSILKTGIFILPAVIFSYGFYSSCRRLKNAEKNLEIRIKLDRIMVEMQKSYVNNDYKKLLQILSEKYEDNSSIISIDFNNADQFQIDPNKIKNVLFSYGFRPEAIAYLFVMLFEALMEYPDWNDFYQISVSEKRIIAKAEELLNAVIFNPPDEDKQNINLEKEAVKLDDKLHKLRKDFLMETWWSKPSNKFNTLKSFLTTKGIIDDKLIKEGQETSFLSRLNEVRSIAAINSFLFALLYDGNELMAKQSLNRVQELLNLEYKYVTDSHLRFEVLKDFIWLFTTNNELTDMVYKETHKDDDENARSKLGKDILQNEMLKWEIEAARCLPVQKIKKFLNMKSEYEKIINNSGNDQELKRFAYFGYANCCLNLSQYNLVIKFLHDQKDNEILNKYAQFWLLGSVAHRKMNNNFEKATHFMRLAKQIDLNNELVQKEAKKLEKLEKLDVKNYVRLLDAQCQPITSVDDFIGTRRSHKKSYKILSIDGGGIRGLIPAIWLREIEMECRKPISSLFNMIAGTSTGAIISAALTVPKNLIKNKSLPYSAGDIVDLYMKESKSIFIDSGLFNSFRFSSYTDTFRSNIFKKYFGDLKINDSLTDLVIPAIHENDRMSTFKFSKIHKDIHVNSILRIQDAHSFSYYDALMATTAAPTYFKPHKIGEFGEFMDGGLTCNNPSEIAYHEVKSKCNLDKDTEISVLSLGTSSFIPYQNFHEKSYLPKHFFWGKNLKEYVLPPIEGDIDERMSNLLNDKYNRWQVITENEIPLDICDDASLTNLVELARQHIEDLRGDENDSFNKLIKNLQNDD